MPIFTVSPTSAQLKAIREGVLIHLTRHKNFGGIVSICTGRPGAERARCNVHLMPSVGTYKNLSVLDPQRLKSGPEAAYVYWFLGEPNRLQRGLNVQNAALLPGWKPPPDEMMVEVPGAAVLEQCGGRIFYRIGDRGVASFGDYRGPAMVGPIPIR